MIELRPEVQAFAQMMELRLRAHDEKKGTSWKKEEAASFLLLTRQRLNALERTLQKKTRTDADSLIVAHEASDAANFCMMLADVFGVFPLMAPPEIPATATPEKPAETTEQLELAIKTPAPKPLHHYHQST